MKLKILGMLCVLAIGANANAEANSTQKEILAKKYSECAASTLRTGMTKTAFNQQVDREATLLTQAGLLSISYAAWLTSYENAKNLYMENDKKLLQVFSKYKANNGSRSDIYNYTVNYLVPKNEKCAALLTKLTKEKKFIEDMQSEEASKFLSEIMDYAKKSL